MEVKDYVDLVAAILAGVATAIPLIYKLIQFAQECVRERNWTRMLDVVLDLMEDAEGMFDSGALKEDWVVEGVMSAADAIDYDIDEEDLRYLIHSLCMMSKKVNAKPEEK